LWQSHGMKFKPHCPQSFFGTLCAICVWTVCSGRVDSCDRLWGLTKCKIHAVWPFQRTLLSRTTVKPFLRGCDIGTTIRSLLHPVSRIFRTSLATELGSLGFPAPCNKLTQGTVPSLVFCVYSPASSCLWVLAHPVPCACDAPPHTHRHTHRHTQTHTHTHPPQAWLKCE
jgi:hypothetical protein